MHFRLHVPTELFLQSISILFVVSAVTSQTFQSTTSVQLFNNVSLVSNSTVKALSCDFAPGLVVGNRSAVEYCCGFIVRRHARRWTIQGRRLTTYLEALRQWECPQFQDECQRRVFAFTGFTKLLYDYFCDYPTFVNKCFETINETYSKSKSRNLSLPSPTTYAKYSAFTDDSGNNTTNTWKNIVNRITSNVLEFEDLQIPCVQVALYERGEKQKEGYHEVFRLNLPGCEFSWCGYDGDTLRERFISLWTCMSRSCQAKMIVVMVICGLLGFIITLANITVIVVYAKNPLLRHSQGIYKMSLAFADILVGIFVFPSFIVNLARIMFTRQEMTELRNVSGYQVINGSLSENITIVQLPAQSGRFLNSFPRTYLDVIGFFTFLSFSVSIYSLTVAGFDRLSAVYRPLSYRKDIAKKLAKKLCVGLWVLGALFSIIPVFVEELSYSLIVSLLIASGTDDSIILYVIAFVTPLLLMWIVNVVTFHFTKKHSKIRRKRTKKSKKKHSSMEARLARTLSIMVGVFTLSIVPAVIVLISSLLTRSINSRQLRYFNSESYIIYSAFEFAITIILACNSLWNFFIYSARSIEFRKAVRKLKQEIAQKLGVANCSRRFMTGARRVVDGGRRRLSSLPTLPTLPTTSTTRRKKSSLIPTSVFNFLSRKSDASVTSDDSLKTSVRNSAATVGLSSASTSKVESSHASSSQFDESSTTDETSHKPQYTRNQKERKKKKDNSIMATDDSIFQSFAIDTNADRLFLSVMENINEQITEDKRD